MLCSLIWGLGFGFGLVFSVDDDDDWLGWGILGFRYIGM